MINLKFKDKNEVFDFEKIFCNKFTKAWINKAWDLRNSSEVLYPNIDLKQMGFKDNW